MVLFLPTFGAASSSALQGCVSHEFQPFAVGLTSSPFQIAPALASPAGAGAALDPELSVEPPVGACAPSGGGDRQAPSSQENSETEPTRRDELMRRDYGERGAGSIANRHKNADT